MRGPTPTRTDRSRPDVRWLWALFALGAGVGLLRDMPALQEAMGKASASVQRELSTWQIFTPKHRHAGLEDRGLKPWSPVEGPMDPARAAMERANDPVVREDEKALERLMAEAAVAD